jgi:hypothetical protein
MKKVAKNVFLVSIYAEADSNVQNPHDILNCIFLF